MRGMHTLKYLDFNSESPQTFRNRDETFLLYWGVSLYCLPVLHIINNLQTQWQPRQSLYNLLIIVVNSEIYPRLNSFSRNLRKEKGKPSILRTNQ